MIFDQKFKKIKIVNVAQIALKSKYSCSVASKTLFPHHFWVIKIFIKKSLNIKKCSFQTLLQTF